MFSILHLRSNLIAYFLTIYQYFHLFFGFIFDKLAPLPPEHVFQKMF